MKVLQGEHWRRSRPRASISPPAIIFDVGLRPAGHVRTTSSFDISSNFTWLDEFTSTPGGSISRISRIICAGSVRPDLQPAAAALAWHDARITWNLDKLSLSLRHRYIGPVTTDRYLRAAASGVRRRRAALDSIAYPTPERISIISTCPFTYGPEGRHAGLSAARNNIFNKRSADHRPRAPSANTYSPPPMT